MLCCYSCEQEINEEEEVGDTFAECDTCVRYFHLKCNNTTKKEVTARKGSKCLRLLCSFCIGDSDVGTKLKDITNMLFKLDLFNQQQIVAKQQENDTISAIAKNIKALEAKVSKLESGNEVRSSQQTHTYANVVKRNNINPAVVVKPKNKQQQAKKTFDDITTNVQSAMDVVGTRKMKDGGIVLRCNNTKDTMKVKQIVNEKLGDDYEVVVPKVKLPRLRITNIDPDLPNEDILTELTHHNPPIEFMEIKTITVINRKFRDNEYKDMIVEVNGASFKQLIDMGKLRLPWRTCKIFEHLHLTRCYKCCGFSHKSMTCEKRQKCGSCSGSHKISDCKSKFKCCINCKTSNDKYKTKLDTKHSAWSKECPIVKRQQSKLVNKIEYNESE